MIGKAVFDSDFCFSGFLRQIPPSRTQARPRKTKEAGLDFLGFSWIPSSDSGLFKGFWAMQSKKCYRLRRRRSSSENQPKPHHPAKGVKPQLAWTPATTSMPTSLSVPPPRRWIRNASLAWIAGQVKNRTRIFCGGPRRPKLAPGKRCRKARASEF
jgi:hypothetical protein